MCQSSLDGKGQIGGKKRCSGLLGLRHGFCNDSSISFITNSRLRDFMEARPPEKRILFVCSGNLCRSFMAERIFGKQLRKRALQNVKAESAGLLDLEGADADPRAVSILREKSIYGSGHRSRLHSAEMIDRADRVLVMEEAQRQELLRRHPDAEGKVRLLKSFSPLGDEGNLDIQDPHGRESYRYRSCFAEIYFSVEGLFRCI
jgi:protein-tyrosine phosphatase